ncbi:molybdate ABC transporter substrate-binding protein [Microbulbifer rhizosphaerae]|uniref:Molybdate transport system substrate-binding protein n=1 Tax=Microbulbifer rhizosphaerae TaxID=1562603 RepID=A0A7W4WDR4_9GAMM|nr:molybdate ABC transporter substrate-binding protein [Microbulbifer rhizosphaerae]MBB3062358.1 molybdate transport system substrate-binding protein [Microbulbifer rhizosphaerae]
MAYRLTALLLILCLPFPAPAAECRLRVAVAASFRPALESLLPEFQRRHDCGVQLSSGSSGVLYQQLVHGAPYDLFLSADRLRPELLERQGLLVPGSRASYARGLLALWAPGGAALSADTLRRWRGRVVIADPELAPFGAAAREALSHLGLWSQLRPRLARAANAGQAYLLLESGHGGIGFVAASQLRAAGRGGDYWLLPENWYPPIEHQLAIPASSRRRAMAESLSSYLRSPAVQRRLVQLGYGRGIDRGSR